MFCRQFQPNVVLKCVTHFEHLNGNTSNYWLADFKISQCVLDICQYAQTISLIYYA